MNCNRPNVPGRLNETRGRLLLVLLPLFCGLPYYNLESVCQRVDDRISPGNRSDDAGAMESMYLIV